MSAGWSWFVILITVLNVVATAWLLFWARTKRVDESEPEEAGHEFDGIRELDMPLPRWWLGTFVGSMIFLVGYLVLYPGLGNFSGVLGWSQQGQHAEEVREADARFRPIYAAYASQPIPDLIGDPKAVRIGQRLFANHCTGCHGADAHGGPGYPNLADGDWQYGGDPEAIVASITNGRNGVMPAFAPALGGEEGIRDTIAYVLSLSGRVVDPAQAEAGKTRFATICAACHGPEGKGNPTIGAPNLTDGIWLYGGSAAAIEHGLRHGRMGKMPAHRDLLTPEKIHLVAAYVFSLGQEDDDFGGR